MPRDVGDGCQVRGDSVTRVSAIRSARGTGDSETYRDIY